jgi:hypothetical protein
MQTETASGGSMEKATGWLKGLFALAGMLALGLWLGAAHTAKASSDDDGAGVQFQLAGISEQSSLLVYQPGTKTVYVYQGATTGSNSLQCSFMFQLTRPGEVIHRVPCRVPSLTP